MNKKSISKLKEFLILYFVSWALVVINTGAALLLDEAGDLFYGLDDNGSLVIGIFAITIIQIWAIYKYILKK
tara:strand:+ start:792 stop:1007 length:216 start_codon:yes stop_codon:yes gene_type:complete